MPDVETPFNDGWQFKKQESQDFIEVTLPHDAMISEPRSANAPSTSHQAFFHGGRYHYRKEWYVDRELTGKQVSLRFDGVFRRSKVFCNGADVGSNISGYTTFEVSLTAHIRPGHKNVLEVHVDNSELPSARWYTGSGIYRPVTLIVSSHVCLQRDGVRLITVSVGSEAIVSIELFVNNPDHEEVDVSVLLVRSGHQSATWSARSSATKITGQLIVQHPCLWSADTPSLYDCTVCVGEDVYFRRFGIRKLEWRAGEGLLVNGILTLLRGGCVHHDSGIIGAATFKAAEIRRVSILKSAGFNAIRSSHNPAAPALLEACDEVGMYVMDEYSDYWYDRKTDQDDAPSFEDTWRADLKAMIAKDRNHACVIMYSVGNENNEPTTAYGVATAKRLLDYTKELDPTRPTTMGVNLQAATATWPTQRKGGATEQPPSSRPLEVNSELTYLYLTIIWPILVYLSTFTRFDISTREVFAASDIAGYNYGEARYDIDASIHPERLIVGTETMAEDLPRNWVQVKAHPNLIGDFMWTAWDYLGECGVGCFEYGRPWYQLSRFLKPYPYITAGVGAFDIIGSQTATALIAKATWGVLKEPVVMVRPPHLADERYRATPWRRSDAIASWSWKGCEGQSAYIEVVSQEDEIELTINGRSLGRAQGGWKNNYIAKFQTRYEPGEVVAVGFTNGVEQCRSVTRSAGSVKLKAILESDASPHVGGQDLSFVRIKMADEEGIVEMLDDDELQIHIEGHGALLGFGNGRSETTERFDDDIHSTYLGRALAVIRSGKVAGTITVSVTSRKHGSDIVKIKQR